MFCKECGTENLDTQAECVKCKSIINTNLPLNGGDRTKIIAFFALLILPFGWFGGSVVIILIAIFGLYIMKKDQSFTPIINAKKWMKAYLIIVALFLTVVFSIAYYDSADYNYDKDFNRIYNENVKVETAMVAGAGLIATPIAVGFFMFVFNSLFFRPLEKHQNWVINNGVFSDEINLKNNSTNIVGRDNLSSYSVADEMLKWNALLEKGLITEEEFTKMKEKILEGKL